MKPRACVITGYGINADRELAEAFERVGARASLVHVADLIASPREIDRYAILAFPGGFSFGDHLGSGRVFAHLCRRALRVELDSFLGRGGLVIGICNGFQVLAKMGVLPGTPERWEQQVSLVHNARGRFEDRWVRVAFEEASPCVWTRGLPAMDLPVRHGEGRFVARSADVLRGLESGHLAAARYVRPDGSLADGDGAWPDNPNGSEAGIAGICDPSGRVFGLMPHPEACVTAQHHYGWPRTASRARRAALDAEGAGLSIFRLGVQAARET